MIIMPRAWKVIHAPNLNYFAVELLVLNNGLKLATLETLASDMRSSIPLQSERIQRT
jgi:hypothetical protein